MPGTWAGWFSGAIAAAAIAIASGGPAAIHSRPHGDCHHRPPWRPAGA
jgi:hypothetical protein